MFKPAIDAANANRQSIEDNLQDQVGQAIVDDVCNPLNNGLQGMQEAYETFKSEEITIRGMLDTARAML